jgi:hypothetical protein
MIGYNHEFYSGYTGDEYSFYLNYNDDDYVFEDLRINGVPKHNEDVTNREYLDMLQCLDDHKWLWADEDTPRRRYANQN